MHHMLVAGWRVVVAGLFPGGWGVCVRVAGCLGARTGWFAGVCLGNIVMAPAHRPCRVSLSWVIFLP
jgi:hypothetical protein